MGSPLAAYRRAADGFISGVEEPRAPRPQKVKLTAGQHILHLLLTVFTGGLWAPVWIIRAIQGN